MMKKFAIVLLGCISIIGCQPTPQQYNKPILKQGNPQSVGLSPQRLENIDHFFQAAIDSNIVKGISGMIVREGTIAYYKSFGHMDGAQEKPLPKDAIYRIASQTKAITSVAVMMLFEEGEFLLDDPIERYLPEFSNMQIMTEFNQADSSYKSIPASKKVTIRNLLTHTSGMSYFGFGIESLRSVYAKNGLPSVFGSDNERLKEFSETASKLPLMHEPGEKFTYGINTDILGRLVEVTSGLSLNEFFTTRIFEPLGMKDTHFYLPEEKQDRLTAVFKKEKDQLVEFHGLDEFGVPLDYPLMDGTFYGGGAGLSSTLMDYAIFLQMMLNGGTYNGHRILSRRSVDLMISNQLGDQNFHGNDWFGLGFQIKTEAGQAILGQTAGSFEWGGYYGTKYWADPKEQLIGLMFVNQRASMPQIQDKFKVLTYAALDD